MARTYNLKRRAERQKQTRARIVEAAVELHSTIGPARTTVSAVAERAGVQRHTYYRHFPDERSLRIACSGLHEERDPLPDPDPWAKISDPADRLRRGLTELYAYFARNESLLASLARDAEIDPPTREIVTLRFGPRLGAIREALAEALAPRGRPKRLLAMLDLALEFQAWQSLVRRSGLTQGNAVEVMLTALTCSAPEGRPISERPADESAPGARS